MRRLWAELGSRCIYQGVLNRVVVVAGLSSILCVTEPFK